MLIARRVLLAALPATLSVVPRAMAQGAPPQRLRGTIAAVAGDTLTVGGTGGKDTAVTLDAATRITLIAPARIEDIKPGSFIGTAALPQKDGTLMAMEIQVFPESMRGVGEGHRPWDLRPGSTMTNGTVGTVTGTSGRRLTMTYKGGEQTVTVPAEAPVITYEPGTRAALVQGAHVIVAIRPAADGTLHALYVGVGKDGLTPPM